MNQILNKSEDTSWFSLISISPVQFLSSASKAKPLSQRHRKLPMVFRHLPLEHRVLIILHSFMSRCRAEIWLNVRCSSDTLYVVHCEALPLRKGLPLMKSPLCEKPGPRGQSCANSGVPFSGHSSHSGPQATPTEQQQASTRCLPDMGVPQRSSSWVR